MASRDRSASLPALFIARQQRVEPQIDPELGRAPARARRKSRRPSMLDALVPKATIPAAAPGPESPEHAWEALCQKAKTLPKPDLDANPPLSIEDIRRAALTEWVAEVGNAITGGGEMSQYQIEVFSHVMAKIKVRFSMVITAVPSAVTRACSFTGIRANPGQVAGE